MYGKNGTFFTFDFEYDAFEVRTETYRLNWPRQRNLHWIQKNIKKMRKVASPEELKTLNSVKSIKRMSDSQYQIMCQALIDHAERFFKEAVIDKYPHAIAIQQPEMFNDQMDFIQRHMTWLSENIKADRYIAYPTSATGKYKEDCRKVFFKERSDMLLFRMSV